MWTKHICRDGVVTVSVAGSVVVTVSVAGSGVCLFPESLILITGPVSTARSPAEVGRNDPTWPTLPQEQLMLSLANTSQWTYKHHRC